MLLKVKGAKCILAIPLETLDWRITPQRERERDGESEQSAVERWRAQNQQDPLRDAGLPAFKTTLEVSYIYRINPKPLSLSLFLFDWFFLKPN